MEKIVTFASVVFLVYFALPKFGTHLNYFLMNVQDFVNSRRRKK